MSDLIKNLELQVLSAICQIIDKALSLEQTLADVLRILSETLSMKRGTVTLVGHPPDQLAIWASHGLTQEEELRGIYKLDEGVTGRIFQTAQPYYVPDIRKDPLFLDRTGARKIEKGQISFIGVPILLHGRPIGVLNVDRLFGDDISFEEDVRFLAIVATLIAQFISLNEQVAARVEDLRRENVRLRSRLSREDKGPYIVGSSPAMQEVMRQIEKVAVTKATVLLLGESGTGKSLVARIIHDLSDRKNSPFVKVNCASIPENLLESELFGHDKGAFTGAISAKAGRFEDAHRGTIFLDEIGELSLGVQAKLLRVLQDREFERLGSNTTRKVDVRILTATNKDLEVMTESGQFRLDFYYRLNVFPIKVPPLRDRREDIPKLLTHFLQKVSQEYHRRLSFTSQALSLLKEHSWPGNVREMENLVERLVILVDSQRIDARSIRSCLASERREEEPVKAWPHSHGQSLREIEREEVIEALRRYSWNQNQAARSLGITPRQIGYRVRKFRLGKMIAEEKARLAS